MTGVQQRMCPFCRSFEDPDLYTSRGGDRRRRATFDFVKEGKLQKQAQIGRLRVGPKLTQLPRFSMET